MPTHPRKPGAKTIWREYLKGEYQITDPQFSSKIRHDIRERAIQLMEDLLLICQKMSREDRMRIFYNLKTFDEQRGVFEDKIGRPLWSELTNNLCIFPPDSEHFQEIQDFTRLLIKYGVPFNLIKLADSEQYREQKKLQLYAKSRTKT